MLVGVDFDNTIVCYDRLFHRVAVEQGLIPANVPANKGKVSDYLRQCGRERDWTELQGYIYGACMREAIPFPGVVDFFTHCVRAGIPVSIISHKTRFPFLGPVYDLHQSAHEWLESHGFYDPCKIGLSPRQVYFELTKQEKLDRIIEAGCGYFIDDLREFLVEPGFPRSVMRILFDPSDNYPTSDGFHRGTSWKEIEQWLIGVIASG